MAQWDPLTPSSFAIVHLYLYIRTANTRLSGCLERTVQNLVRKCSKMDYIYGGSFLSSVFGPGSAGLWWAGAPSSNGEAIEG